MKLSGLDAEKIGRLIDSLLLDSNVPHPAWNQEQVRNHSAKRWNYIDGCMLLAFLSLYQATEDRKYLDFDDRFLSEFINDDGEIATYEPEAYSLDNINEAKPLIPLFELTGKKKYRKAADFVYRNLRSMPRTPSGSFWHKKIYPNQIWLDGLYMAMPFYTAYETKYNHMRNCDDIFHQFRNAEEKLRDSETGLYYHGCDESRSAAWADPETGRSRSFWLRAEGWLLMALTDTLEQLDEQIYADYRALEDMLKGLTDALLPYQQKNGMFLQVVDRAEDAGNYSETSGTGMIACGILKAVRLGYLPERYRGFGERAFYGTLSTYFDGGQGTPSLGGICLSAGLGGPQGRDGTPEYYYGEPIVENEGKGLAPFLMAYSELLRAEKDGRTGDDGPYLGSENVPQWEAAENS